MNPEDEFILSFLPVLRKYLSYKKIDNLDNQLNLLEAQLQSIHLMENNQNSDSSADDENEVSNNSEVGESSGDGDASNDKLVFDITFHDLQEDVQKFAYGALGYQSVDDLIKDHPHLDGPICSIEI